MLHKTSNKNIKIFSCYQYNIPEKIVKYQKQIFDLFEMEVIQEKTTLGHDEYLNNKINNENFDIIIFFDIDCIPLKPNLYNYILEQVSDNNSIIGVEQAANHIDSNVIYAGPACFAISKTVFEKLNKPSFSSTIRSDIGGEFTFLAKEKNVNVKFFEITSSLNKKWKCGNKYFGNGTIYKDWLYHQFEIRYYYGYPEQQFFEYQFINKCKEILNKYQCQKEIK